jgi:hypothetical protein
LDCRGLIVIAGNQEALKAELRQWADKFEAAAEAIEREARVTQAHQAAQPEGNPR